MDKENIEKLNRKGFCKLDSYINERWINKLKIALPNQFRLHQDIREKNNNAIVSEGVAMNLLVSEPLCLEFLQFLIDENLIQTLEEHYFKTPCILNSFSALNVLSTEPTVFHKKIHRDIRGYSGSMPLLLNLLVMIDDFTETNGATLLLPYSHLIEKAPTENYFKNNAIKVTGKAGDIIIWNSNVYHASGLNTTNNSRTGLPITLSLPYYKQLLDYPKALNVHTNILSDELKALLGFDAQVPDSLYNWYQSDDNLLYKNKVDKKLSK